MQLAWLEDMTKEGSITATERDRIYLSCGALIKEADVDATKRKIEGVLGPVANYVVPPMIDSWLMQRRQSREVSAHMADLEATKQKLLALPDFANHQEKAEARFTEVARLAPTVARNQALMERILKEKLHSGLTHEDVTNLAMIQATYTPNYTFQKKLEKTAAAETAGEIVADILILCKEAGIAKEGGKGWDLAKNTFQHAVTMLAAPALLSVGAGAVNMAMDWRSKANREKALTKSFAAAMDPNHPDTELLRTEPERAREAFQTLAHFAPSVALEPSSARSFMNKLVSYQGGVNKTVIPTGDLKELSEIEKNMRGGATGSAFFKGFAGGLKETGFGDAVRKSMSPLTDPLSHQLSTNISKSFGLESTKSPFQPHGTNEMAAFKEEEAKRDYEKKKWDEARLGFNSDQSMGSAYDKEKSTKKRDRS